MFLDGEIPSVLSNDGNGPEFGRRLLGLAETLQTTPRRLNAARSAFADLQARLDREVEEFATKGALLRRSGDLKKLAYVAGVFMQHAVERLDLTLDQLDRGQSPVVTTERGMVWSDR